MSGEKHSQSRPLKMVNGADCPTRKKSYNRQDSSLLLFKTKGCSSEQPFSFPDGALDRLQPAFNGLYPGTNVSPCRLLA
jgi:hypothetical protein